MIKAVFFDLNGVLITSLPLSSRFEAAYGVPTSDFVAALKTVMMVTRMPAAPSVYSLFEPFFKTWNISITEKDFLHFWFSGELANTEALEYVALLCKRGMQVYVLSNNFKERALYYRTAIPEVFYNLRNVYFSFEIGFVKPSKEALLYVLRENDLEASEVVYFDDTKENIEVAKQLGIDGQQWIDLETAKAYVATNSTESV